MSVENELQQFIEKEVAPESGVAVDEPLISSGKVDSLGLLQILGFIEQRYGVTLLTTASPQDFENINALAAAVRRATTAG
ncbi:MAG TPA: acyl carrier protein [Chthonomonadales bacterium]|nr:acyl carrier protein [Chthonomonadales bacterium]